MTALRVRLDRLEQTSGPKVLGRFVCVRAGSCSEGQAKEYLATHGVRLGARDVLFVETHADPGTLGYIAADEPLSHEVIEITRPIEELIGELD